MYHIKIQQERFAARVPKALHTYHIRRERCPLLTPFYEKLHITDTVSVIIVSIALILICGFAATRVTKRLRLPNVTAYIVAGILIGPYCLNLVPGNVIDGMDFIADIALAFIAFSTGEFFKSTR